MSELLEENRPFEAIMALVVYSNGGNSYMESHTVTTVKGKTVFGPAKPLLEDTLAMVVGAVSKEFIQHHDAIELIPENVLLNCQTPGNMNIMWYLTKPKKELFFKDTFNFKTDSKIQLPNILFQWKDRSLYVYCFKENKRPSHSTQFYKAPFPNTNVNGLVCLGTASVNHETKSLLTFIASAEHAFFNSEFNHGGKGNTKGDFHKAWEKAYADNVFPPDQLVKSDVFMSKLLGR